MELKQIMTAVLNEVRCVNSKDYGSETEDFKDGYDAGVSDAMDAIEDVFSRLENK